jgi:serine/threonine-protein kinase
VTFAVGSVVAGRYLLNRQLGGGGFATVFLAADLQLERPIALKMLHLHHAAGPERERFLVRFGEEARLVARLDHPHILSMHDSGEAAGLPFLVMPYVGGGTLAERLRRGPLPPARVAALVGQLAGALDYAHAQRVVHRDIKPANVLLRDAGLVPLLADFGIAKAIDHTSTGTAATGTVAYMAPELFDGWVSPQSDIYALGCLCFELLTGQVPYQGTVWQTVYAHQHAAIPLLAERGLPGATPQLQAALAGALAKEARGRYASAGAFAREVAAALGEEAPPPATIPATGDAAAGPSAGLWSLGRAERASSGATDLPTRPSRSSRRQREVVRGARPRAGRLSVGRWRSVAPLVVLALLMGALGLLGTYGMGRDEAGQPPATAPVVGAVPATATSGQVAVSAIPTRTATPVPTASLALTATPVAQVDLAPGTAVVALPSPPPATATATTASTTTQAAVMPNPAPVAPWVYVANPDGEGTYLCGTPNREDRVVAYPNGTRLGVTGANVEVDGVVWTPVRDADGRVGYVEAGDLSTVGPSAAPSSVP